MIDQFPFSFLLAVFFNLLQFWCLSLDMALFFYFKASFILRIYSFFFTLFCDCAGQSSTNQYPLFPPPCKPSYKVVFFLFLFSNFILLFFLLFSSTNHQSISPLFPPISSYKIIFSSCKQTFLWRVNHTNLNKIKFLSCKSTLSIKTIMNFQIYLCLWLFDCVS